MPKLSIMPALCRETFGSRTLPREPEPQLIMDGAEQVAAYASAARSDGAMTAAYLFHTARISMVLRGLSLCPTGSASDARSFKFVEQGRPPGVIARSRVKAHKAHRVGKYMP